jgi:biotin carboxyl carrier protein
MKRAEALWKHDRLVSPLVGWFRPGLAAGDVVRAGHPIGTLEVLGSTVELVAPAAARGVIREVAGDARVAVDFDHVLYIVDPDATLGAAPAETTQVSSAASGLVFAAPTSGRFYGRSAPDRPPFVSAGTELVTGTTICLLEVMKTFHRVAYTGERAKVTKVLVDEGADVNAGDALVALEPT